MFKREHDEEMKKNEEREKWKNENRIIYNIIINLSQPGNCAEYGGEKTRAHKIKKWKNKKNVIVLINNK